MLPKNVTNFQGKEAAIQSAIVDFLTLRQWFVMVTHGNMYQRGFPDLFATHSKYGYRWVEVKHPTEYCFTPAQIETFPKLVAFGSGVWIMSAATQFEYEKLWKPCNWYQYL